MWIIILSMALILLGLGLGVAGVLRTPNTALEDNEDRTYSPAEVVAAGTGAKKSRSAQRLTSAGLVSTSLGGVLSLIPSLFGGA